MVEDQVQETKAGVAPPTVKDLAEIVVGMSRLLTRLSLTAPFLDAKLSLAEWSALIVLSDKTESGITSKQLAKELGVTAQRANQICNALEASGLATVAQAESDGRKNAITVTQHGSEIYAKLNDGLQTTILDPLSQKSGTVSRIKRSLRLLSRSVVPQKQDITAKKAENAQRKASKGAKKAQIKARVEKSRGQKPRAKAGAK